MKLRNSLFLVVSALLVGSSLLGGCTSTDTTTNPPSGTVTDPRSKAYSAIGVDSLTIFGLSSAQLYEFTVAGSSPYTKVLGAAAQDIGSIKIFWTRDVSDIGVDTVYYEAVSTPVTIDTFSHNSAITWATAAKSGPFTIYETSDPSASDPSGLVITGTNVTTSAVNSTTKSTLDIVLFSDNTVPVSNVFIGSPDVMYNNTHLTRFAQTGFMSHGGAVNNYFTSDLHSDVSTMDTLNAYNIPGGAVGDSSLIIPFYTANQQFGRIEIVPDPNTHTLWRTNGTYHYVVANVWVQPQAGWGYALPAAPITTPNTMKHLLTHIVRQ